MTDDVPEFREELQWNSYFVDSLYDAIETEVQHATDQYEEEYGTNVPDEKLDQIVETIIDDGLNGLRKVNDSE
ncbi:hypothetical protein OB919_11625 [Halobacteria archaeon AArc-curdl1]|uniref:Uncharacterized protein n=1 Tax=Natronosalvus hydrolyticus TaxID=2979988 RepID=A0AAP2ZAU8_9EURY|nr:hypothetical protein [Halobacteria archaeon AArc-curdl1]